MKLSEILLEKMMSGVYVNPDETLHVLGDLFKHKEFKIDYGVIVSGACLLSQVVYTISAATGIDVNDVANVFHKDWLRNTQIKGRSLKEIIDIIHNSYIVSDKKFFKLKLSVELYHSIDGAIADVKIGQPVIFVVTAAGEGIYHYAIKMESQRNSDGVLNDKILDDDKGVTSKEYNHAYMVVGYDSAHKHVILRDIKSDYSFKGYLKVGRDAVERNFHKFKVFAVTVDSKSEIDPKIFKMKDLVSIAKNKPQLLPGLDLTVEQIVKLIKDVNDDILSYFKDNHDVVLEVAKFNPVKIVRSFNGNEKELSKPKNQDILNVLIDKNPTLVADYMIHNLPSNFVIKIIDKNQKMIYHYVDSTVPEEVEKHILEKYPSMVLKYKNVKWKNETVESVKKSYVMRYSDLKPSEIEHAVDEELVDVEHFALTSLEGIPKSRSYNIANNHLKKLSHLPNKVESFDCSGNELVTLEGSPQEVEFEFKCSYNRKLVSFKGGPKRVGDFVAIGVGVSSIEGLPEIINEELFIGGSKLKSIKGIHEHVKHTRVLILENDMTGICDAILIDGLYRIKSGSNTTRPFDHAVEIVDKYTRLLTLANRKKGREEAIKKLKELGYGKYV